MTGRSGGESGACTGRHEALGSKRYAPPIELAALLAILLSGFVVGGLARLAVPGPDPMPIWKTIAFGVAGSFLGGVVGYGLAGAYGAFMGSLMAATLLVLLYRRLVQKRPITGPEARLPPR